MSSHVAPILDPTGREDVNGNSTLAPRSRPLVGAVVALLDNGKVNGANLLQALGRLLVETEGVGELRLFHKPYAGQPLDDEQLGEVASSCDFVVTAVGDCGSCSAATLADGILLERAGVPAASICTEPFAVTAAAMAEVQGFPGYRFVSTRHPIASLGQDELDGRAREVAPQVLGLWGVGS
jgi:hypothetical protein